MHPASIQVEGLERRFGDFTAVAGIDLQVEPGEIYGFLGPNGAGKSTTCRMLCTLTSPTGGRAMVAGYDVARQPGAVRLAIGAALQATALDLKQTGNELLRQQGRYYGLNKTQVEGRLAELRTMIDLGDALDRPIGGYSGGMKRRVDLAAALLHNPRVLFLDEPTTGLDPSSRALVWEEVRRLNTDLGVTIFLTTQYLEEADALANRVGIIDRGVIVAEGTPGELKRRIGGSVIRIGVGDPDAARGIVAAVPGVESVAVVGNELTATALDGPAVISPIAVALANANIAVHALTMREPSLDDVFLTVTGHHLQEEQA
jgi:ABC-2 type transport system ATP-binding protein